MSRGLPWIFMCAMVPAFIAALIGSSRWPHMGALPATGLLLVVALGGFIFGVVTDR